MSHKPTDRLASLQSLVNEASPLMFEGKEYKFVELDVEHMAKFSAWLLKEAQRTAQRMYSDNPQRLAEAEKQIVRDGAAGVYDWGGEIAVQKCQTIEGQAYILCLSAEQAGDFLEFNDAVAMIKKRWEEINALISEKIVKDPKGFMDQIANLFGPMYSPSYSQNRSTARSPKSKSSPSRKSKR